MEIAVEKVGVAPADVEQAGLGDDVTAAQQMPIEEIARELVRRFALEGNEQTFDRLAALLAEG